MQYEEETGKSKGTKRRDDEYTDMEKIVRQRVSKEEMKRRKIITRVDITRETIKKIKHKEKK